MAKDDLVFGDDQPKDNPWQDDRLGYAPFAERIFNVVVRMPAPNGYVIGLHGPWGSGKSTVLNFVDHFLRKHNEEAEDDAVKVTRIDFRPWNVSGHQDLIVAFFKVLSESLGPKDTWWQQKYKGFFRFIGGTTDGLVDAAATVALTIDPSGGVASGFAGNLAKKSVSSLIGSFLEDPSLQSAYESLKQQLAASGRKLLITIDDIDRLQPDEVRDIMRMVKTVGKLPNVIYLLAYDRDIVWKSLDGTVVDQDGPRFAEKIVQQELELPKPARNALFGILDDEIRFLTGDTDDNTRWQYIVMDGVQRWVNHPRDVLRLSNAVKFAWPSLKGEFDAQDLLTIEGMRLFDPIAFDWIKNNRDFIFNEGRYIMAQDEDRKASVEALKKRLPEASLEPVMSLMSVLFPNHSKWFEKHGMGSESYVEAHNRRGLANRAAFESYFAMHLTDDAIPKASLEELLRITNAEAVYRILLPYIDRRTKRGARLIAEVLGDIRFRFASSKPPHPTTALLAALFRIGEEVHAIPWTGGGFSGQLEGPGQLQYLIKDMLKVWGLDQAAVELIKQFHANGAAIDAIAYFQRGRELKVFPGANSEPVISPEAFDHLGAILLEKLRVESKDGTLAKARETHWIIQSWKHLSSAEEPKKWLDDNLPVNALLYARTARSLMSASSSSNGISYALRQMPDPAIYDANMLLNSGADHLTGAGLGDDERKLVETLVGALERAKAGKAPRSFEDSMFDVDDD